jgi:hypothetical protein
MEPGQQHLVNQVTVALVCGRLEDAAQLMRQPAALEDPVAAAYLAAHAGVREGRLEEAVAVLLQHQPSADQGLAPPLPSAALLCRQLLDLACGLLSLQQQAQAAMERAQWASATAHSRQLLSRISPLSATGLAAQQLHLVAEAHMRLGEAQAAVQALDDLLAVCPGSTSALWSRAEAHMVAGSPMGACLSLMQLQQLQPDYPGLQAALQDAARSAAASRPPPRLAASRQQQVPGQPGRGHPTSSAGYQRVRRGGSFAPARAATLVAEAELVLGVPPGASPAAIRGAWKVAAAKWHPDKWVQRPPSEQAAAEEKFKQAAAAYQALTGSG